jgi:putative toxin-antitoxin system antitoxin component (TIGR02293 family)
MDVDLSVTSPAVWEHALLLFGNESKATRWLTTRLSELGDRTPNEVLQEDPNSETVLAILDRIDYGVFG